MGLIHLIKSFALTIRESATDGSDFSNPDADYRVLFLGEDGLLHVKDSAGTVTDPYTTGGGSADAILGQSGIGGATISGLQGSPDIDAAGGSDDEFNTTDTSDPMTGWTTIGTPTAHDMNSTALSHYHIKLTAAAGIHVAGIQKAKSPAFTVTCKLSDFALAEASGRCGLMIGVSPPGAMVTIGMSGGSSTTVYKGEMYVDNWTNPTTYGSTRSGPTALWTPRYFRFVVASSTDVTAYFSHHGILWTLAGTANFNPGFTVGCAGLVVNRPASGQAIEALFDWIRFT